MPYADPEARRVGHRKIFKDARKRGRSIPQAIAYAKRQDNVEAKWEPSTEWPEPVHYYGGN